MNDPMYGIDATNAGLFSAAAYNPRFTDDSGTLHGWAEDAFASQETSTDRVRVFYNSTVNEVVLAFKGTDNWSNFKSDLADWGASDYSAFHSEIEDAYTTAVIDFPSAHFFVDGHSLGGGMAQNFALEEQALGVYLDGFGQNSLPETVASSSLDSYRLHDTFVETDVAGDPATLYFRTLMSGQYIDLNPTILPSIYPALEIIGMTVSIGVSGLGAAIAGWSFYYAHQIATVNSLSASYVLDPVTQHLSLGATSSSISQSDTIWFLESAARVQSVQPTSGGTLDVQDMYGACGK